MRARTHAQRGLAAVEMALIMPVFLLLMLGTAELGRACYQYNTLVNAAREGARYISARARNGGGVVAMDPDDITAAANLIVSGTPADGGTPIMSGLEVGQVTIVESPADYITVTVAFDYQPVLVTIPASPFGDDIDPVATLTATAVWPAM